METHMQRAAQNSISHTGIMLAQAKDSPMTIQEKYEAKRKMRHDAIDRFVGVFFLVFRAGHLHHRQSNSTSFRRSHLDSFEKGLQFWYSRGLSCVFDSSILGVFAQRHVLYSSAC